MENQGNFLSLCGQYLCIHLAATFLISLTALGVACYFLVKGNTCDSNTAYGIVTTVLALWAKSPFQWETRQQQAEAEELAETLSTRSRSTHNTPLTTDGELETESESETGY